jgi:hypothetical protein
VFPYATLGIRRIAAGHADGQAVRLLEQAARAGQHHVLGAHAGRGFDAVAPELLEVADLGLRAHDLGGGTGVVRDRADAAAGRRLLLHAGESFLIAADGAQRAFLEHPGRDSHGFP